VILNWLRLQNEFIEPYLFMNNVNMKNIFPAGPETGLMPVLFLGHGSPMNAITENEFALSWRKLGKSVPVPKAILCISAHWETRGTHVTAMAKPATIHDFGGFPPELYKVIYPAPGSPELAREIKESISDTEIGLNENWGLDHGAWSVIRNMFPDASIPVIEMSLDYTKSPQDHYDFAKELSYLRTNGVLIIGSGNMVHNLGMLSWDRNETEFGFDWALQANATFKNLIVSGNFDELIDYPLLGREVQLAVPTPDHYLPLLYSLALKKESEPIEVFNDKPVMGSLTMTSFRIG
jgi:4,5-DOPA dioxygenase extradiol